MGVYNIQAPAQCGFRAKALSSVDSVRVPGAFRPALRTALPRARRHARCNTQQCARTGHAVGVAGSTPAGAGASGGAGYRSSQPRVRLLCGGTGKPIART